MKKGKDLKPHIGIFGRRNNGKSSFINAIIGQEVAIVSEQAGTTTDPVKKSVEIFGVGPAIMIDTAGIDDHGELGEKRIKKTLEVITNIDFAILLIANNEFDDYEIDLLNQFKKFDIPFIIIHNKSDLGEIEFCTLKKINAFTNVELIEFSTINKENQDDLIETIKRNIPKTAYQKPSLFKGIVKAKDIVLMVTPIDSEAPDGRMILPQVMSWRDLLDHDCICISVKETELEDFIKTGLKPVLVVTDSQVFDYVSSVLPEEIPLTSFSILFARLKGDFEAYIKGTQYINQLKENDNILVLESCSHQISCDDIGRFKIPVWLQAFTNKKLNFEFLSGSNPPKDISSYALVIQCGGCVATRKQILNRIKLASDIDIPITNYGMLIAYINGIFNRVVKPFMAYERINIKEILQKGILEREDIIHLLKVEGADKNQLFKYASEVKNKYVGDKVFLRGLIEYSNICKKDCYYCGIRSSNKDFSRYEISMSDIEQACNYALENKFGSMVIQCGELQSNTFTEKITNAIKLIKFLSNGRMRITLSCGEQTPEVYKKWFKAGAERYLLRIESSNPELYKKIHPENVLHNYDQRIESLKALKEVGFQTGTGVMIGLPFQTIQDLADDILFMRENDIDMCGMGPYIEHENTPLFKYADQLMSLQDRYQLALKMIAVLRIVMKNINIASTTALQAIDSKGKRSALEIGANVIMPNLTPAKYKSNYHLYKNKPGGNLTIENELEFSVNEIKNANCVTAFGEYGDAIHFLNR